MQLGTVTRLSVHPASPVLLTKNSPLGALDSVAWLDKESADPTSKSNERFPCQYRCGPPPEFPLASPRSSIVHYLSGPNRGLGPGPPLRMLLQTTIRMKELPDSKAGLFPFPSSLLRKSLFTYGNLVTNSPSLNDKFQWTSRDAAGSEPPTSLRSDHFTWIIQLAGTTGGVYKGQGRSQRMLMTRAYKEFLVEDHQLE
ncbi:hypothetical protein T459_34625 [Capsicum annuum]|uniref:Uncharacterized protein n=1 Tax=Capsicum annuum TaxID=4072 RepID=A0A2G2XVK4_CAPAN|nr:hypothetical protein T459_34625 [Capsicum annuum]